jgi:hypothetical protein
MKRVAFLLFVLCALFLATDASAQTNISCTDSTNTVCTVKKNQPFSVTADPALTTDAIMTEKFRLYVNGAAIADQASVAGMAPVFNFPTGLATTGEHTIYMEAIGRAFDASGNLVEIKSGPSNVARVTVVTGSLSAPKNVKIVGAGGGQQ